MSTLTSSRVLAPIGTAGKLFAFGLDVARGLFRRPFQMREFLQQAWFIASVTIVPTALVAIPFGAVIALQVGGLIKQFGAQSFTGSAAVLAVVREAGPIATSLLIAGAGGSAIAADLGARKIREELDAMMVLGNLGPGPFIGPCLLEARAQHEQLHRHRHEREHDEDGQHHGDPSAQAGGQPGWCRSLLGRLVRRVVCHVLGWFLVSR